MNPFRTFSQAGLCALILALFAWSGCKEPSTAPSDDYSASVSGVLTDHDNYAVPEAVIEAYSEANVRLSADTSDEDGNFSLDRLPEDFSAVQLRINHEGFKASQTALAELVSKAGGKGKGISVLLESDSSCCGKVQFVVNDSSGNAIDNAQVKIRRNQKLIRNAKTSANGMLTLENLCLKEFSLHISRPGYKVIEQNFSLTSCDSMKVLQIRMLPLSGNNNTDSCCNGVVIINALDSATQNILSGAEVRIGKNGTTKTLTTSQNGVQFRELCPGEYSFRIAKAGYGVREFTVNISCNDTIFLNKYLISNGNNNPDSCCKGWIRVTPKDSSTNSVLAGAEIKIIKGNESKVYTASQSGVKFENLCPGTYHFRVAKQGYPVREFSITITCNDSVEIVKYLMGNGNNADSCCKGRIFITMKDSTSGFALANATVKLWLGNSLKATKTTSQNGQLIFENVCPGNYQISVSANNYYSREWNFTMACNDSAFLSKKLLQKPGNQDSCCKAKIRVGVKDSTSNAALSGATVKLWLGNSLKSTLTSGANGVLFENLCPGTYQLSIMKDGYFPTEWTVTVSCNQFIEISRKILAKNDSCCKGNATVVVRDSTNHAALANATVKLWKNGVVIATRGTNGNGAASFEQFCEGIYGVSILRDGYHSHETSLVIDCNGNTEYNAQLLSKQKDSCCTAKFTARVRYDTTGTVWLAGATVTLKIGNTVLSTKTTNNDGIAVFENLCAPATYTIVVTKQGMTTKTQNFSYGLPCVQKQETFAIKND